MNILDSGDHEGAILENIQRQASSGPVRQRELAGTVGISLGMTNVILKRLAQKGWVKIRKINNRNIHYAVTPSGIEEIARRSLRFLKRTIRDVSTCRDLLEDFIRKVRASGARGVILVGKSDFDFLVAHICQLHGLRYVQAGVATPVEGYCLLHSEDVRPPRVQKQSTGPDGESYLQQVLLGGGVAAPVR